MEPVYAALSKKRIIMLSEDVDKQVASTIQSLLMYYNNVSQEEDIVLLINTAGGDATALVAIYDTMRLIQAPITTLGAGRIYSAGAFLLAAGTPGKRTMLKNAEVMIHGLQCSFPEIPLSDQTDAKNYYSYLDSFNKKILKILAKHTGQPISKITADAQRDMYLSSEEAVAYGLIDFVR